MRTIENKKEGKNLDQIDEVKNSIKELKVSIKAKENELRELEQNLKSKQEMRKEYDNFKGLTKEFGTGKFMIEVEKCISVSAASFIQCHFDEKSAGSGEGSGSYGSGSSGASEGMDASPKVGESGSSQSFLQIRENVGNSCEDFKAPTANDTDVENVIDYSFEQMQKMRNRVGWEERHLSCELSFGRTELKDPREIKKPELMVPSCDGVCAQSPQGGIESSDSGKPSASETSTKSPSQPTSAKEQPKPTAKKPADSTKNAVALIELKPMTEKKVIPSLKSHRERGVVAITKR